MNKITKLFAAGLLFAPAVTIAQNGSVSTTPEKKTAVLEEYTGNYCTYCPQGHTIAADIEQNYKAITLKIQTGGFSGTDPVFGGTLKTQDGELIAAPFDSQGYPNGTVSRRTSYAGIGRGDWESAVSAINGEDAPVNLNIVSSIDVANRTLDVDVEYYYTATEANATNYLHIGYYQDNIAAYQYDPGFNPGGFYLLDETIYEFDHAFRAMVNGTWGEVINTTAATNTGTVSHQITLPAAFSTFDVEPGAIKVFAYMTTTNQGEILNATKATPTYSNFPDTEEIEVIWATSEKNENCNGQAGSYAPKILMNTHGSNDLASFDVDYSINGTPSSYSYGGSPVKHNEKFVVTLDPASYTWGANNTLTLTASNPNGQTDANASNNGANANWSAGTTNKNATLIRIDAKVDQYGDSESTWELYDGSGTKIAQSGKLTKSTTNKSDIIEIPNGTDCYTLKLIDTYGDGWGSGNWAKIYDKSNGANTLLKTLDAADMTYNFTGAIELTSVLSVNENAISNFNIYPNPSNGNTNVEFNVASSNNTTVSVINTLGQVVLNNNLGNVNGTQRININGENLENGIYFVNITIGDKTTTQKLTISK